MDSDINAIFKKLGGGSFVRFDFDGRLQRNLFERIVQRFIYKEENGGLEYHYVMKTVLKIIVPDTEFYVEIDGKNEVKRHWQFSSLPENCYKLEKVMAKHSIDKYGIQVKLVDKMEKESEKGLMKAMSGDSVKEYVYINYYEVEDPKFKFKTNLVEERRTHSSRSFKESDCLTVTPVYYVEMIFDGEGYDGEEFDNYFGVYLKWLLEEVQQTNFIITVDERLSLLNSFKRITKQSELRANNFILAEPVEVLRRNFHKSDRFPFVKEDYGVALSMEGDLRFLYISENFSKNVDGKMFMVTQNFDVISTGRKVEGFENSLLEGYYSEDNNLFYITDILYYKGKDVRQNLFYKSGGSAKEKYRYDYLGQFYKEGVMKSKYVNEELREEATRIIPARYLFGNGPLFEENINELFDKVKMQDFTVSGIHFRPMNDVYPERGGKWYSLFKWNYPQFRRVDFLVNYRMDGKNQRLSPFQLPSKGKDLYGKIIYYKSLELKVSGYKDIPGENEMNKSKILTVMDFMPVGVDPKVEVNVANIPLSDSGKVVAHNILNDISEEIMNNYVVEFSYTKIYGEYTSLFKWTPVRVDYRKTKLYNEGDVSVLTTAFYSNHVWNAYTNIITETHMREGTVPEEDLSNVYYANNTMRLKKFPFQIFHNRIVKDNLIKGVCPAILMGGKSMMGSLLDLACGSGGDFAKWKLGMLKNIVGIDVVKENIDLAVALYKKVRRPKPDVVYIWGDSNRLIFPDFDCGMDYPAREMMKKTILSKYQFDVVSIQFAIHYMFESEITVRTLLQNVSDNLKIGGYFVGTSLDGERVYDLLVGKEKELGMVGDDLLWKIGKEYNLKKWDRGKNNLGHEIEVFVSTIGIPHKEYLVNYDYLKEIAKEYGLEVTMVRGFGDIYQTSLLKKTEWDGDLRNMSAGEKVFSFLHNEFVFKKVKNASDQTYKKLLQLIAKKEKKDERLSKFNNNRIKIKLKSGGKPIVRNNSENNSVNSDQSRPDSPVEIKDDESVASEDSVKTISIPDELSDQLSVASDSSVKSIEIPDHVKGT